MIVNKLIFLLNFSIFPCTIMFQTIAINIEIYRKRCHRCVVIYEKHKNVLQYKESECEENKDHFKASALSSRSTIIKSDENRGVALAQSHPNMSHTISTSDLSYFRSNDDSRRSYNKNCKQKSFKKKNFNFIFSYF